MAEPIVRSFVIDTTESEQNLKELNVQINATSATINNASQSFNLNTKESEQNLEELNAQVKDLGNELKDIPKDIPKETIPKEIVPPEAIANTKSLKAQLRELQVQLANTEPDSKAYVELATRASELKDKISDAAEAVGTQAGSAFERVGNSLGLVTGRLANLDFEGAAEGAKLFAQNITSIKFGDITSGIKSLGSTLASVGKALLTNPIFLIGAALAVAIDYTSQFITGLDGISEVDQKNLAIQQEKAALAKKQVDSISAQENILRQQGVSEREILNMKIKALETAILEQEVVIKTTKTQADAQVKAAERNFKYLKGFLDFVTLPQKKLTEFFFEFYNGAVDLLNKLPGIALEKVDISKVTSTFDDVNKFLAEKLFNPAETKKEADATVAAAEDALINLKNQKAGIQLQIAQQDKAFRDKELAEDKKLTDELIANRKKVYEESKKITEQIQKDAAKPVESPKSDIKNFDDEIKAQRDAEAQRIALMDEGVAKEIAATDLKYAMMRDAAQGNAEQLKLIAQKNADEVAAIEEDAAQKRKANEFAVQDAKLQATSDALGAINQLVGAFARGDEKRAKRAFQIQKALSIAQATVDTYKGANAIFANAAINPATVLFPAQPFIAAGVAIASGLANVATIAQQQFQGGSASGGTSGGGGSENPPSFPEGGGGGGSQPAQFNPLAAQFLQERPEQLTPRAFVLAGDVASQQEVRQKVEDLARIG